MYQNDRFMICHKFTAGMSDLAWNQCPILIGGHQKSGTNLMLSLLDNHHNLVVFSPGHLHLFSDNMERISSKQSEKRIECLFQARILEKLKDGNIPGHEYDDEKFDFREFRNHMKSIDTDYSWNNIISKFFIGYRSALSQNKKNIVGFVESTPGSEHNFSTASALFPDAKMLQILRDPRDVWSSYKDVGQANEEKKRSIWNFLDSWISSAVTGASNSQLYDNYYIVDYNQLVEHPDELMSDICNFLRISNRNSLLTPTKMGEPWGGNSRYTEEFRGISADSVGVYDKNLSRQEINILDNICVPIYRKLTQDEQYIDQSRIVQTKDYIRVLNPIVYYEQNSNVSVSRYLRDYAKFLYKLRSDSFDRVLRVEGG